MPAEKLAFGAAFTRYTSVTPYLEFMEDKKGVIKAGAKADFMMLDAYPDDTPETEIHKIKVRQTWVNGEKVYDINS